MLSVAIAQRHGARLVSSDTRISETIWLASCPGRHAALGPVDCVSVGMGLLGSMLRVLLPIVLVVAETAESRPAHNSTLAAKLG